LRTDRATAKESAKDPLHYLARSAVDVSDQLSWRLDASESPATRRAFDLRGIPAGRPAKGDDAGRHGDRARDTIPVRRASSSLRECLVHTDREFDDPASPSFRATATARRVHGLATR
jgi:hypothetical protein